MSVRFATALDNGASSLALGIPRSLALVACRRGLSAGPALVPAPAFVAERTERVEGLVADAFEEGEARNLPAVAPCCPHPAAPGPAAPALVLAVRTRWGLDFCFRRL